MASGRLWLMHRIQEIRLDLATLFQVVPDETVASQNVTTPFSGRTVDLNALGLDSLRWVLRF